MIITSVVVLAIVGSAFAFKAKGGEGTFCVTGGTANTDCFTIQNSFITTGNGVTRLYYPNWDGVLTHCTNSGIGTCDTRATFTVD